MNFRNFVELSFETTRSTFTNYVIGYDAVRCTALERAIAGKPFIVIVDDACVAPHSEKIQRLQLHENCVGALALPGGEAAKSMDSLTRLLAYFQGGGLRKDGVVVVLGGGAVCDVAALAALLSWRGVELVLVPTTLLAQVDAAIGGKNGINFGGHKNSIGYFHHPRLVCCDQEFLKSLSHEQIACGMAEIIKVFAVADKEVFLQYLTAGRFGALSGVDLSNWSDIIQEAVRLKLDLLRDDPFERSSRRSLNYGHAMGHLLEEHSNFQLSHGIAVLMGMLVENEISRELGIGAAEDLELVNDTIAPYLPSASLNLWGPFSRFSGRFDALRQTRRGALCLVCLESIGTARIVDDVPEEVINVAWNRALANANVLSGRGRDARNIG